MIRTRCLISRGLNEQKSSIALVSSLLRRRRIHQSNFSSAGPAESTADAVVDAAPIVAVKQLPNKALFPWRHETKDNLLPRLIQGSPESIYFPLVHPNMQGFIATMFLNVPFWQTFFGLFDWRGVLAESSSFALSQGVAGIVSNVYKIPFDDIIITSSSTAPSSSSEQVFDDADSAADKIDFRYNIPPTISPEIPLSTEVKSESSPASNGKNPDDNKKEKDFCNRVEYMLDRPLRNLFKSAHEHGKDKLQIRLQMQPTNGCAVLYSLFCIPFLTRKAAEADPQHMERMRKVIAAGGFGPIFEYVQEQMVKSDGKLETTVEMQVLVECDEIFQVIDKETGVVLQGSPDGSVRRVVHLVCLETTCTTYTEQFVTDVGNWIITDIDDLLGPKKWYHK
jgi:hypothetical protein